MVSDLTISEPWAPGRCSADEGFRVQGGGFGFGFVVGEDGGRERERGMRFRFCWVCGLC